MLCQDRMTRDTLMSVNKKRSLFTFSMSQNWEKQYGGGGLKITHNLLEVRGVTKRCFYPLLEKNSQVGRGKESDPSSLLTLMWCSMLCYPVLCCGLLCYAILCHNVLSCPKHKTSQVPRLPICHVPLVAHLLRLHYGCSYRHAGYQHTGGLNLTAYDFFLYFVTSHVYTTPFFSCLSYLLTPHVYNIV